MRLIGRSDLRCPESRCEAMIVEYRAGDRASEYRCKLHGPVRPLRRLSLLFGGEDDPVEGEPADGG